MPPPSMSELKKGILKSKSGCVGMFPTDLNAELKLRLQKSNNAAVGNLKKSTTAATVSYIPQPNDYSSSESGKKNNNFR